MKIGLTNIVSCKIGSTQVNRVYIGSTLIWSYSAFDPDAQLFITNAAITEPVQQNAVNNLVINLKNYGIWSKMKALYPFVGGTAAQHKFNLKNPLDTDAAFRLVFNGGWTHSSNGALPNGVNGYADTFFNSSINGNLNDGFACTYLRTNQRGDTCDIGNYNNGNSAITIYSRTLTVNDVQLGRWNDVNDSTIVTTLDSRGFRYVNRLSSTIKKIGINSNITSSTASVTSSINAKIFISALSFMNSPGQYSGRETAFSAIGDGLTDTEAANYYTAVQTFQTTLGRQVGVPIVSDSDAQAFLNAAVITDTTQASAVNTLVTDLKGYGIWTKMKALYPFVGGTAAQHKFNLRNPLDSDAAFRLVFNGGWVHSSGGALPNGTNSFANTFLIPNTSLQLNSAHISFYSRTNITSKCDIGASNASFVNGLYMLNNFAGNINYFNFFHQTSNYIPAGYTRGDGFFSLRRNTSTEYVASRNLTTTNHATASLAKTTFPIYLSSLNNGGTAIEYSARQAALASIGDGLDNTEWANYYTAVQTFQTTLGRNV